MRTSMNNKNQGAKCKSMLIIEKNVFLHGHPENFYILCFGEDDIILYVACYRQIYTFHLVFFENPLYQAGGHKKEHCVIWQYFNVFNTTKSVL